MPTTASVPATAGARAATPAAWLTSVLLLVAGLGAGLAAVIGVATPHVPGTLGAAGSAAWVALLPGVLAVLVTAIRPIAGLALVAGAGIAGIARLLADLFVLLQPESVARPELLYPLSATAFPLRTGAGGWVLVLADLLAVLAGALAARALARTIRELGGAVLPDSADGVRGSGFVGHGDVDGQGHDLGDGDGDGDGDPWRSDDGSVGPAPAVRNMQMLAVGFIAIAIFGFSAIQATYTGGYIDMMLFVPGSDAGTVIAPFLLAFVALCGVVVAGGLPRTVAVSLLGGIAVAVAVPAITALVVAGTDAPVQVSSSVVGVLTGAVVLLLAGLLTRARWRSSDPVPGSAGVGSEGVGSRVGSDGAARDTAAGSTGFRWAAAVLGLLAGVLLVVGRWLDVFGGRGPVQTVTDQGDLANDSTGLSFLVAGIVLVLSGAVALIGRSGPGRAGRAALTVVWGAAVWALARPISLLGEYRSGTDQAELALSGGSLTPEQRALVDATVAHWSIGPGMWCALVAATLALVAAVLAGLALARELDEVTSVRDDDAAEASAQLRRRLAAGLAVVTVIALALPLSQRGGVTTAALFSLGADSSWAGWAVLVAVLVALVVGASSSSGWIALGALTGAAGVMLCYVLPPAGLRADAGFATGAGTVAGWVVVVLLLAGAPVMWWSASRVAPAAVPPSLIEAEPGPSGRAGQQRGQSRERGESREPKRRPKGRRR
ncbi:hypothetical protein [Nakamurella lactea]|uniref:hypothetical protein n=1 Tax=Nakamurella lactea TaxID=459515 RepID=UPI0004904A10|nr:hypothetical protein [Nakamurella lactea]